MSNNTVLNADVDAKDASTEVSSLVDQKVVRRLAIQRTRPLRRFLWICVWIFVFFSILATIHQTVCFFEADGQAERISERAYGKAQEELEAKYGADLKFDDFEIAAERQVRAEELLDRWGGNFQRGLANAYSFNACLFFIGIFAVLIVAYSVDFLLLLALGNSIRREIYLVELMRKLDGKKE